MVKVLALQTVLGPSLGYYSLYLHLLQLQHLLSAVYATLLQHRAFVILVQEQGLKNVEFGDTQYTQGLTSVSCRGHSGDCP